MKHKQVWVAVAVTYLVISFVPSLSLPQLLGRFGKKA